MVFYLYEVAAGRLGSFFSLTPSRAGALLARDPKRKCSFKAEEDDFVDG